MNSNDKTRPPTSVPRTLRPKAVCVSPIKSPVGTGLQAVGPFMTSQGTGQFMIGGNVQQMYQANLVSQSLPSAQLQPRMSIQPLFTQQQQMPYQMASQISLAQNSLLQMTGTQGSVAQFPLASGTQGSVAQFPLASGTQGSVGQFPLAQSSFPVLVSAAPMYQNMSLPAGQQIGFQPGVQSQVLARNHGSLQIGYPTGINQQIRTGNQITQHIGFQPGISSSYQAGLNSQITTGNQFSFQANVGQGVQMSMFSPLSSSLPNTLQIPTTAGSALSAGLLVSSATNCNPQNILLTVSNPAVESDSDISLIELSVSDGQGELSSSDNLAELSATDSPAGTGHGILSDVALCSTEDAEQSSDNVVQGDTEPEDSETYTEITLEDGLFCSGQGLHPIPQEVIPLGNPLIISEDLVLQEPEVMETEGTETANEVNSNDTEPLLQDGGMSYEQNVTVEKSESLMGTISSKIGEIKSSTSVNLLVESINTANIADNNSVATDSFNSGMNIEALHEVDKMPGEPGDSDPDGTGEPGDSDLDNKCNSTFSGVLSGNVNTNNVTRIDADGNGDRDGDAQFSDMDPDGQQEMDLDNNEQSVFETDSRQNTLYPPENPRLSHPRLSSWRASPVDPCIQREGSTDSRGELGTSSDVYESNNEDSSSISWEKFRRLILKLRPKDEDEKSKAVEENAREHHFVFKGDTACEDSMDSAADNVPDLDTGLVKTDGMIGQSHEDGDEEEPEFVWEDYLQQTGTTAVPPTAFKHVEHSLQSGFIKGMKLEVQNKEDPSTFWVASVLSTCGPLLRLRYDGYGEDDSADFWCDLATTELHPIGWSAQNGRNLQPPDDLKDRVNDWRSFLLESLTGARTAPASFFEKNTGSSPVDQLKCGMKLELQDVLNPLHIWLVQILQNVGGRLYLRLEGTTSASKHFWMFYLNPRLHPIGWVNEHEGCIYRPPQDIYDEQTDESWSEILQTALKECENDSVPEDVFKDQPEIKPHQFTVGMKLEALIPGMNMISPATVSEVINDRYFLVEIDDLRPPEEREKIQVCCNSEYLGIFPVSWCQCKGIRLTPPQGLSGGEFVWGEYLSYSNAKAAPEKLFNSGTDDHDFERGMKLEAVNPDNPNQICAATITKIVGPLLWIHLDHMRDIPSHIEDIDSHNLFPVGWCESNNYQLKPPLKTRPRQKQLSECKTEEVYRSIIPSHGQGAWCPKIYINHRCFSGPYLSKGRISDIPRFVGPGPIDLVLKEVLSLLISIAYVPCRALKEIQQEGPYNPYMKPHILKAKYKGKKYKAIVEVCQTEDHLEDFCRNICIKLECCPYLFSTLKVKVSCPENCQQLTKTKSHSNYGKKKKFGHLISSKPHLSAIENGEQKKRGRKRKGFQLHQRKGQKRRGPDNNLDLQKDEGFIDDDEEDGMLHMDKRNYDIQTRGAKLPKYSFEKKSHRKIFMSQVAGQGHQHKHGFKRLMPKTWSMDDGPQRLLKPREGSLKLVSNPLHWSVAEVVQFLKTTDCSHLARIIKDQEIDGQAFLLLNLSTIQDHLELKLGPAVKLCHHIETVKLAFYENYA